MSSRPTIVSMATIGALGLVAYMAGRKTKEVFGADASPSDIERAMVENPAIVPTISPIALSGGHQGALYRGIMPATSDTLRNGSGSMGSRPVLTDVIFDSAFASGYSRATNEPYKVVSHNPANLQPSFTQYGGGTNSTRPQNSNYTTAFESETFKADGDGVEIVSNDIGAGSPYTDSTKYSGDSGTTNGVALQEVDAYEQWDMPCCRVCPPGAEGWCEAINGAPATLPQGQRLSPFQNRPLLADPYTLKATTPLQNGSYTDDLGGVMTIGELSKNYDISVSGDYTAVGVARDGSSTRRFRRV